MKRPVYPNILISFFLLAFCISDANGQTSDYSVHANIIYRLTKYIDWPDNKKSGDFVIGILGDSPIYEELKKTVAGKTVGNQKIVIVELSSSRKAGDCQILFINNDESNLLKGIILTQPGAPILIVTEERGLCLKGACINMYAEDDKLILEINKNSIEKRDMHVAGELLNLAKLVESK